MLRFTYSQRNGRRPVARFAAGATVLALTTTLAACGSNGEASTDGGTLTVAQALDPRSLYPTISNAQAEVNVSEQIVEKLIEFNPDGTGYEPRLATEWSQLDPKTLELTLRKGVKFTNGEDFNPESVVKSLDIMVKSSTYEAQSEMIDHAEPVGDSKVRLILKHPSGLVLSALAAGSFQYPMKYLADVGEDKFGEKPIGTGPYKLTRWMKGQSVELEANPEYWNGEPAIKHVEFSIIPDKQTQVLAAQSGKVDVVQSVPIGSINSIKSSKQVQLVTTPSNRNYYVAFSELTDTPLRDARVRQAIQHAIDTQSLINDTLQGLAKPLQGQAVPDNFFGFDETLPAIDYDPQEAQRLLKEAGYPNGVDGITFKYTTGYYAQDKEIGQAIANQLAKVGIEVRQEVLEPGAFLDQIASLKLNDMFFQGPLLPPDAQYVYRQFQTGFAYSYYSNKELDQLLEQANVAGDEAQRADLLHQMARLFQEDPPFAPLFQGVDTYALSKDLASFELRPSQFLDLRSAEFKG